VNVLIHEARHPVARIAQSPTTDLAALARERLRFWSFLAAEQNRKVTIETPDEAVPVRLSPEEAIEVFDCLIDNVFSHTEEGVPFGVSVSRRDGSATLLVADGGDAPDPELIRSLFEPGVRGTDSSGTGFGLEIVRRRARSGGGDVRAYRHRNGGLAVEVELPVARQPS